MHKLISSQKKLIGLIALMMGLTYLFNLHGEIQTEDMGTQNIYTSISQDKQGPFTIDLNVDYIDNAKVRKKHRGNLLFATGTADANLVYYYNECHQEAASIALAYQRTLFDWNKNPYFNEKNFNMISLILGGLTKRLSNWLWKGQLAINFDNVPHWKLKNYMSYDLVLWGRYEYRYNLGFNIGFIGQTGMKINRIYPIAGIDWSCGKWKLNAVYPVNLSVVYAITPSWSFLVAGRLFDQRHRVKKEAVYSQGLWHYQGSGAELGITFNPTCQLKANIHAGYSFGAHVKISDKHNQNAHHRHIENAPYLGGDITLNF